MEQADGVQECIDERLNCTSDVLNDLTNTTTSAIEYATNVVHECASNALNGTANTTLDAFEYATSTILNCMQSASGEFSGSGDQMINSSHTTHGVTNATAYSSHTTHGVINATAYSSRPTYGVTSATAYSSRPTYGVTSATAHSVSSSSSHGESASNSDPNQDAIIAVGSIAAALWICAGMLICLIIKRVKQRQFRERQHAPIRIPMPTLNDAEAALTHSKGDVTAASCTTRL